MSHAARGSEMDNPLGDIERLDVQNCRWCRRSGASTATREKLKSAIGQHRKPLPEFGYASQVEFNHENLFVVARLGQHDSIGRNDLTTAAHDNTAMTASRVALDHVALIFQGTRPAQQ